MRCPCCERPLEVTHRHRYEDLSEHVSNPNGTPSMKDGYQCTYEYCIANNLRATWIEDGDIFSHPPEGIKFSIASDVIRKCSVSGTPYALDSWQHYYELGKISKSKRTKNLYFRKWFLRIEPKDKGWDYPENERHQPSRWKYKLELYKKSKDSEGYTMIIPTHTMVIYCVKKFNREYKSWKETKNRHDLENCYKALDPNSWENRNGKFYNKIARYFIETVYPNKCKEIFKASAEKQNIIRR